MKRHKKAVIDERKRFSSVEEKWSSTEKVGCIESMYARKKSQEAQEVMRQCTKPNFVLLLALHFLFTVISRAGSVEHRSLFLCQPDLANKWIEKRRERE